jgi:hypothetical protein
MYGYPDTREEGDKAAPDKLRETTASVDIITGLRRAAFGELEAGGAGAEERCGGWEEHGGSRVYSGCCTAPADINLDSYHFITGWVQPQGA